MNWQQLKTVAWLRWRLTQNRLAKAGAFGRILAVALAVIAALGVAASLILPIVVGTRLLPKASPDILMLIWDLIVGAFLFFWLIGVITELQRSDALSLDKLLHLPVSPRGAFLLNYMGSWLSISLVTSGSLMVGMSIALVVVHGVRMLLLFPLVLTALLLITAVTYQFRGWVAALMQNKRRRGTILALMTLSLILFGQLPNLLQLAYRNHDKRIEAAEEARLAEVDTMRDDGQLTSDEADRMRTTVQAEIDAERDERKKNREQAVKTYAFRANMIVPVGWLPYGARGLARGEYLPALLGSLGAAGLGLLSLQRSYRTTLRVQRGALSGRRKRKPRKKEARPTIPAGPIFLERQLGGFSEETTVVGLATLRSLLRAPQAKMLMLTPIILLIVFGSLLFTRTEVMSDRAASLAAMGAVVLTLLILTNLAQNVFGLDRDGFRSFVLSPAPRRSILLGKNLAMAPFVIVVGGLSLALVGIAMPLRFDHLLASALQLFCVYLICCLVGNATSVAGPMALAEGGMKPARTSVKTVIRQMIFGLMFPLAMLPSMIPLALELVLEQFDADGGLPVYLLLSALEVAVMIAIYRWLLDVGGRYLQRREQAILAEVASRLD